VAVFLSSSDTHGRKNIAKTLDEALAAYAKVCAEALRLGMKVRGYVSTVWGCPYEGPVPVERSVRAAAGLLEMGCQQVSLGDTIGVGTPRQTAAIVGEMVKRIPKDALAMHMHDTRGTALANVLVGLQLGLTTFDAAVGGLGGCPLRPRRGGEPRQRGPRSSCCTAWACRPAWTCPARRAGRLAQRLVGHELPGKYLKAALGEAAP
jgi:hydroxymethylglutaryl-CoA lyase